MDLQISVFLLLVLFAAGHSFRCYNCNGTTSDTCQQTTCNEYSSCFAATAYSGNSTTVVKSCLSHGCPSGSINFGMMKASLYCCDTDLCNAQNVSDLSNNTFNGRACYYCDGQSCSNTVNCSGTEDRCFNTGTYASKGCVSKSICAYTTFIPFILDLTCCEGNLCNGDNITQSTTQSTTQSLSSTQSTTQSLSSTQSTTQSSTSMQSSTKSTTQSLSSTKSTTQSSTSMQSSTQSTTQSVSPTTANGAESVSQSFLFLCCSLLSFILLH